ncbi:MAG TPA: hypothetical protein VFX11_18605 [Candidatus Kapabacteria bacterium]|nr:hypothetical protein [Candidatus Kapabacteria bacterium]
MLRKPGCRQILMLLALSPVAALADDICPDPVAFIDAGWQHESVQDAMDDYLRDHRMRANWGQEPVPPDAVGRDYYEWLWISEFGAKMKGELVQRFCGATQPAE